MSEQGELRRAERDRIRSIMRVSAIGIAANVALAVLKATIGTLSHSIAITLDAVNNLSDSMSSAITMAGTRLAGKPADHHHPFGHGRIEYLTTMIVGALVLAAGITALAQSIRDIRSPEMPDYQPLGLAIIALAVVVKLALSVYFRRRGMELASDSLVASGKDAFSDVLISLSTLAAAAVYLTSGIAVEPWVAAIISLAIIKNGVDILREATDKVLGERVDAEVCAAIREAARSVEGVRGVYDLTLTDYGPERLTGSAHIEVDESLTAREIDRITREVQRKVLRECHTDLHTIGIYSTNVSPDSDAHAIREALDEACADDPYALEAHGLYLDTATRTATFDLVVSFDAPSSEEVRDGIVSRLEERFRGYRFRCLIDSDIAD